MGINQKMQAFLLFFYIVLKISIDLDASQRRKYIKVRGGVRCKYAQNSVKHVFVQFESGMHCQMLIWLATSGKKRH